MDSIRVSEAPDSGSIPDEATIALVQVVELQSVVLLKVKSVARIVGYLRQNSPTINPLNLSFKIIPFVAIYIPAFLSLPFTCTSGTTKLTVLMLH